MSFPIPQALHHDKSFFSLIWAPLSHHVVDAHTKQRALFLKTKVFTRSFFVYADKSMQRPILECRRLARSMTKWEVYDLEQGGGKIGHLSGNFVKSMLSAGAEAWTLTDASDQPLLVFKTDSSDTFKKRMMDNMTILYNPTHQYNIWNTQNKPVARIWTKQTVFRMVYDLVFEANVTDVERKMVLSLWANLIFMIRR